MECLNIWTNEVYPALAELKRKKLDYGLDYLIESTVRKVESKAPLNIDFCDDIERLSLLIHDPQFLQNMKKNIDAKDYDKIIELGNIFNRFEKIAYHEFDLLAEQEVEKEKETERLPNTEFTIKDIQKESANKRERLF